MAAIEISMTDVKRMTNIITALRKGKWELEGEEVLAFAQSFNWCAELIGKMKLSLEPPSPAAIVEAVTKPAEKPADKKKHKKEE